MKQSLAILGLSIAAVSFAGQCKMPAYKADYTIHAYGFNVGDNWRTLTVEGSHYKLVVDAKSSLLFYKDEIIQTSLGLIGPKWLEPLHYTSYRMHKDQQSDIRFDWSSMKAYAMKNGDKRTVKIIPGTQDFTSGQLMARKLLVDGDKDINFHLVKSNKLQHYHFSIIGQPTIETKIGKLKTVQIRRLDGPRETDFWLAPKYHYALVRSQQKRDGSMQVQLFINSYKQLKGCVDKA